MLAIIIPYYKLTFFGATLQSLADQTDKRFKVYIGDDASPEDCTALLDGFKSKFDFTYHRFETNLGGGMLTKQWERCIALSNEEEWLMILGDDDVLAKNVVEEFYGQYDVFKGEANLIRFASLLMNDKTKQESSIYQHPKWEKASDFYYRRFKEWTRSSLSEYAFNRMSYVKYKFRNYPLAWHSDDMAWIEFADFKPIYSINEAVLKIGFSDISLSGMMDNNNLKYQASVGFYKDLINDKLRLFSKSQSLELLMNYEVLIKKTRNLYLNEWSYLLFAYFKNFSLIPFVKLLRRIILSVIKK